MPKGDNAITLNLTTELKIFIDKRKNDLHGSFYVISEFLQQHKNEFIKEYGEQVFNDHVKRYSKTAIQLRNEKLERDQKEIEKQELEVKIKKESLRLKAKELKIRKVNSEVRTEKQAEIQQAEINQIKENERNKLLAEKRQIEDFLKICHKTLENPNLSQDQKQKTLEHIAKGEAKLKELEGKA
jgi:hypothetical protein